MAPLWHLTLGLSYLALVNGGFLIERIAVLTSLWAALTLIPAAALLPKTVPDRPDF